MKPKQLHAYAQHVEKLESRLRAIGKAQAREPPLLHCTDVAPSIARHTYKPVQGVGQHRQDSVLTINFRSFEKVNRSTASIRSKGSSESLILRMTLISNQRQRMLRRNYSRSKEIWAVQVLPVLEVRYRF